MSFSWSLVLLCFFARPGYSHAATVPSFIYEIFTQSFSDSNGDGIGDLKGVESRLDYVSSLGADAIWLTPIFPSPSYHGYDVSDYESVKPVYGNLSDMQSLVRSAHAKGIRVLLDVPVNHTSNEHPWFGQNDLYMWSGAPTFTPDHWYPLNGSFYFGSFSDSMPDLNWKNPDTLARIEDVFSYWVQQGVDGFRLDAARYLIKGPNGEQNMPETHEIWKKIVAFIKASAPDTYFVGEVWDSADQIANYYGNGDELSAAFNFPVMGAIRSSLSGMNNSDLVNTLNEQLIVQKNEFFAAPFAGNHDLDRLASSLGSDIDEQKEAALAVFTLPGTPVVYYGDEIGMVNGDSAQYPGDLAKRTEMDWQTADQQSKDPASLLNAYRNLAKTRQAHPVLNSGALSGVKAIGKSALSFLRVDSQLSERALVVLNLGNQPLAPQTIQVPGTDYHAHVIYGSASVSVTSAGIAIQGLGPKQGAIVAY